MTHGSITSLTAHRPIFHTWVFGGLALLVAVTPARAQSAAAQAPDPTIQTNLDASEVDSNPPKTSFNEFERRGFSLRIGGGFLYDYSTYGQDETSKSQMAISAKHDLRDFRLLFKGKIPIRGVTYTLGYMYDKVKESWRFRQTGLMVEIRRWNGNLFVGRTKEGFSTSKIMVGYQGWTNERATINDALIPILADGLKWTGTIPSGKLVYSAGFFPNSRTQNESFDKHDKTVTGRAIWLPPERPAACSTSQSRPAIHSRTAGPCSTDRSPNPTRRKRTPSTPARSRPILRMPMASKPITGRDR
jgi:phosphate-selective porin